MKDKLSDSMMSHDVDDFDSLEEVDMEDYDNALELNDDDALFQLLDKMHERNVQTLGGLGDGPRPEPSPRSLQPDDSGWNRESRSKIADGDEPTEDSQSLLQRRNKFQKSRTKAESRSNIADEPIDDSERHDKTQDSPAKQETRKNMADDEGPREDSQPPSQRRDKTHELRMKQDAGSIVALPQPSPLSSQPAVGASRPGRCPTSACYRGAFLQSS